METQLNRFQIVERAVRLAGRGSELYAEARHWLNLLSDDLSLRSKWPILRKTGDQLTLTTGSTTSALPTDWGAGSAHLLFGSERTPIYEKNPDEFVDLGGFPGSGVGNARPTFYMVDLEAEVFRFNRAADQDYGFIPVYYRKATHLDVNGTDDDDEKLWLPNDDLWVEGLVYYIFKFREDSREDAQLAKFEAKLARSQRGLAPIGGGTPRMRLSPQFFRK